MILEHLEDIRLYSVLHIILALLHVPLNIQVRFQLIQADRIPRNSLLQKNGCSLMPS